MDRCAVDEFLIEEVADWTLADGQRLGDTPAGRAILAAAKAQVMQDEGFKPAPMHQFIARKEDMSPNGRLRLFRQDDGDMCVAIIEDDGTMAGVEFCVPGTGGGKSPKTLRALHALAHAILEDNAAEPHRAAER